MIQCLFNFAGGRIQSDPGQPPLPYSIDRVSRVRALQQIAENLILNGANLVLIGRHEIPYRRLCLTTGDTRKSCAKTPEFDSCMKKLRILACSGE